MPEIVVIGEIKNQSWIDAFGSFQKIYRIEEGIDSTSVAKNMLQGIEQKGSIEALGNINAVTGFAIGIMDEYTGMVGVFQIDSDTHTWENGIHTMSLNLNFDEVMDVTKYRVAKKTGLKNIQLNWGD